MHSRLSNILKELDRLPAIFWFASFFVIVLFSLGFIFPEGFMKLADNISQSIFEVFGNFYLWLLFICFILFIVIGYSPLGKIRLGGKDAKPTHSFTSWFAMIFCAGMGVGILFWGSGEPLFHFITPPFEGLDGNLDKHINALHVAIFHWGFSPWGMYGLATIAIAFWAYNSKQGFFLSAIIKTDDDSKDIFSKIKRFLKPAVDLFILLAILFGVAASFGMGVLNLDGGLQTVLNTDSSNILKISIIVIIFLAFIISSLRGLDKGIKIISNISMVIAIVLLLSLFLIAPCLDIIMPFILSIPAFIKKSAVLGLGMGDYTSDTWVKDWTLCYWTWWIAWTPFVSSFIALISKGRTIREIVTGVLVGPTIFVTLWFFVFGNAAIDLQIKTNLFGSSLDINNINTVLYRIFETTPFSIALSLMALFLTAGFFINSADSATYTLSCLSMEDAENTPPKLLQIGWGLMFTLLASLFLFNGGINLLIKVTLIAVLPFSFWLVIAFTTFIYQLIIYYKEEFLGIKEDKKATSKITAKISTKIGDQS